MELHPRVLFNEPQGQKIGLLYLSLSFGCLVGYLYFGVLLNGPQHLLFLGVAMGLSGIAESLPTKNKHLAGILRILAICILIVMLAILFLSPEIIL